MTEYEKRGEGISQQLRSSGLDAFETIARRGYQAEFKNRENLAVLTEYPELPAVLYFNHATKDDPFLAVYLVKRFAQKRLENVLMPVSDKYAYLQNYPQYAASVFFGREIAGFSMPEVVQSYRLRGRGESEKTNNKLKARAWKLSREFIEQLDTKLPGGAMVILSPEGHRSGSGALLPSEEGAGFIAKKAGELMRKKVIANAFFIPVGFVFKSLGVRAFTTTRLIGHKLIS